MPPVFGGWLTRAMASTIHMTESRADTGEALTFAVSSAVVRDLATHPPHRVTEQDASMYQKLRLVF